MHFYFSISNERYTTITGNTVNCGMKNQYIQFLKLGRWKTHFRLVRMHMQQRWQNKLWEIAFRCWMFVKFDDNIHNRNRMNILDTFAAWIMVSIVTAVWNIFLLMTFFLLYAIGLLILNWDEFPKLFTNQFVEIQYFFTF